MHFPDKESSDLHLDAQDPTEASQSKQVAVKQRPLPAYSFGAFWRTCGRLLLCSLEEMAELSVTRGRPFQGYLVDQGPSQQATTSHPVAAEQAAHPLWY